MSKYIILKKPSKVGKIVGFFKWVLLKKSRWVKPGHPLWCQPWDSFFVSELHRLGDSPLGGGSVSSDFPTVYYGETQCPGGRSFSPNPDLGIQVDAEAGGLRGSVQEIPGFDRPVCNILESQMFHIFFSLPR